MKTNQKDFVSSKTKVKFKTLMENVFHFGQICYYIYVMSWCFLLAVYINVNFWKVHLWIISSEI